MVAQIIHLSDYRRGVRHGSVTFPQVYRVTGFSWLDERLTGPDKNFPWGPYYTLNTTTGVLADMKFDPIDRPDPAVDRGWVMVRHHADRQRVDAYLDGLWDMKGPPFDQNPGAIVYQTEQGLFTCVHRPASPNRIESLLFFVTKRVLAEGPMAHHVIDDFRIVDSTGRQLSEDEAFGNDEADAQILTPDNP